MSENVNAKSFAVSQSRKWILLSQLRKLEISFVSSPYSRKIGLISAVSDTVSSSIMKHMNTCRSMSNLELCCA